MNGEEIIKLIGKTISDPDVQFMFKFFNYKEPEKGTYAGYLFEKELSFEFKSKLSFDCQYLDPPYLFSKEDYIPIPFENPDLPQLEFVVEEIHFSKDFKGDLPFGLTWEDSIDKLKKLGTSNGKDVNGDGIKIWYFLNEKYRIQTAINKKDKLEWLRVWWIDNQIKKAEKLKEMIRIQNKNIIQDGFVEVNKYQSKKPTIKWLKDLLEEESIHTNKSIEETDRVLTKYIDNLVIATKEKKANKILSAIKKVVISLNKLEQKYNYIETVEREELCLFILDAVKATGLQFDVDLTEEWREW